MPDFEKIWQRNRGEYLEEYVERKHQRQKVLLRDALRKHHYATGTLAKRVEIHSLGDAKSTESTSGQKRQHN